MTTLQGLCVCLREYTQIRIGTRGMSESVLVLEVYCRIFVVTAACEESCTCFCRDHTYTHKHLLLVQKSRSSPLSSYYALNLLFAHLSLCTL